MTGEDTTMEQATTTGASVESDDGGGDASPAGGRPSEPQDRAAARASTDGGPGVSANGGAENGGDGPSGVTDKHDRAREAVEHLQAAARELIAAARAALDVAEDVVDDPDAMVSLAGLVTGLGDMARRVTGGGWPPATSRSPEPEDERQAKVERIRVT
jgi:hypothetical protein